jgi:hypothetical protein
MRLLWLIYLGVLSGISGTAAAQNDTVCYITNIDFFVEQCPTLDPAIEEILSDFRITRDGVDIAEIECEEPISSLPIEDYTDELILAQGLRIIYYLDKGQAGHLPWTELSLYEWLRSKVGGFNISSTASYSSCCGVWPDGTRYITLVTADESNRDLDRTWPWLGFNVGLIMHEARHVDGYAHLGCCPVGGAGCDLRYDESNLSPYAIQWWLDRAWLDGSLNTGYACIGEPRQSEIFNLLLDSANNFVRRFCESPPPVLDETISAPCLDCQPPPAIIAADDGPFVVQEGGVLVNGWSVLDNDTASNGVSLTAVIVEPPSYASFYELRPDGTFDYTHDGSETTSDTFTYRATDGFKESEVASVLLKITPVNDAPTIELLGDVEMTLIEGDTFNDPGATATDEEDGDISQDIVVGGDTVNTSVPGTYVISYNVTDSAGSAANEVLRTVEVNAAPAPPKRSNKGGGILGGWELIALVIARMIALGRKPS